MDSGQLRFSGAGSSGSSVGIHVGGEGTGHVIANNSIYYAGTAGRCFSTPLAAGAYTFVGNNACYNGTWGTTYDSTGRVTADPLYVNGLTDLRPNAAGATPSPLIGAGTATHAPSDDYNLKARPSPPAIGAFEP